MASTDSPEFVLDKDNFMPTGTLGAAPFLPSFLSFTPRDEVGDAEGEGERAGEEIPSLGDDLAAIRERVLGRRAAAAAATEELTPEENAEVYGEMKKRHQVDLNEEENVILLEDPNLVAHMEAARRRLAEHEAGLSRLPKTEALRTQFLNVMRQMSEMIRTMETELPEERETVERAHYVVTALGRVAAGGSSRNYPGLAPAAAADPSVQALIGTVAKSVTEVAAGYDAFLSAYAKQKQDIFVIRREVEAVGDGLLNIIAEVEEDRRKLREFMQVVNQLPAVRAIADPAHTFGEKVLSSPMMPENIPTPTLS